MLSRPRTMIALGIIIALYGLDVPLVSSLIPWRDEVRDIVFTVIPWVPLILALYFLSGAVNELVKGVTDFVKWIGKVAAGLLSAVVFVGYILPVMLANTLLLGPFSQWMWENMAGAVFLLILTTLAYWLRSKQPLEIDKTILLFGISLAVIVIVGDWFLERYEGVYRLRVKVKEGVDYAFLDPAKVVRVKGGDIIKFSIFGKAEKKTDDPKDPKKKKFYPPKGDSLDLLSDGSDWRPQGQVEFRARTSLTDYVRVPIVMDVAGPDNVAGFDIGSDDVAGGYYLSGTAVVPDGTPVSTLGVGFFNLQPDSGSFRIRFSINPQSSHVSKVLGVVWFYRLLVFFAILVGYWVLVLVVVRLVSSGFLQGLVVILALIIFPAMMLAIGEAQGLLSLSDVQKWWAEKTKPSGAFSAGTSAAGASTAAVASTPSASTPVPATGGTITDCTFDHNKEVDVEGTTIMQELLASGCTAVGFIERAATKNVWFNTPPCSGKEVVFSTMAAGWYPPALLWQREAGKDTVYHDPGRWFDLSHAGEVDPNRRFAIGRNGGRTTSVVLACK